MNPFLTLLLAGAAVGAWPAWRVIRRQRRQSAVSHLPGNRNTPGSVGTAHGDASIFHGQMDNLSDGHS